MNNFKEQLFIYFIALLLLTAIISYPIFSIIVISIMVLIIRVNSYLQKGDKPPHQN